MKKAYEYRLLGKISIIILLALLCINGFTQTAQPGNGGFNYGEALQKAILF